MSETHRICHLTLDERTVIRRSPQIEHERRAAIFDLLDANEFALADGTPGPYQLALAVEEHKLTFRVADEAGDPITTFSIPLAGIRALVRDYFMICESYTNAIKSSTPSRIEAIDMGRRGLHNEGAELLRDALAGKATMDTDTARRLFTLVCVLHIRGRP